MACDIDDREGESPSPVEPRLGGCPTARRPAAAVNKLFLTRSVFVKRFTREMTLQGCQLSPSASAAVQAGVSTESACEIAHNAGFRYVMKAPIGASAI